MTTTVVSVDHDGTKGTVTLTSDKEDFSLAIQELQHGATRNMAITAAAKDGLPDPRCEIPPHPYAVDAEGKVVTDAKKQIVSSYRVDIPVTRKLV